MHFKYLITICAIFINFDFVKSDCVDIITCFGDYVQGFFTGDGQNDTKIDVIDLSGHNNSLKLNTNGDTGVFNETVLEQDLSKILADVTARLKEEVKENLKIVAESNYFKTKDNQTDILVKIIDLSKEQLPTSSIRKDINSFVNNTTKNITNNVGSPVRPTDDSKTVNNEDIQSLFIPLSNEEIPVQNPVQVNTASVNILADLLPPEETEVYKEIFNIEYESDILVKHIDVELTTSKNAYLPVDATSKNIDENLLNGLKNKFGNEYLPTIKATTNANKNLYLPNKETTTTNDINNVYLSTTESTAKPNENQYLPTTRAAIKGSGNDNQYLPKNEVTTKSSRNIGDPSSVNADTNTSGNKNRYLPTTDANIKSSGNKNQYLPRIEAPTETSTSQDLPTGNKKTSTSKEYLPSTSKTNTTLPTQNPISNRITSQNINLPITQTTKPTSTTPKSEVKTIESSTTIKTIGVISTTRKDFYNIKANEIFDETYYEIIDDNVTDYPIIDYVELYKDTTNEIVNYVTESYEEIGTKFETNDSDNAIEYASKNNGLRSANDSIPEAFPWIATVFVKNGSSDRFDYYCDGAVYSDRVVITAARCISTPSSNPQPDSFIVLLGKRSLVDNGEFQRAHRVKSILIHENFTSTSSTENDLALLMMEEPVIWNDGIGPACLDGGDGDVVDAATTGWAASGQLTAIRFDQDKSKSCQNTGRNNFCAVYGNDVSTCPSYGGLYLAKRSDWCVYGIRTGDPSERPFCFDRTVRYTSLAAYSDWLKKNAN